MASGRKASDRQKGGQRSWVAACWGCVRNRKEASLVEAEEHRARVPARDSNGHREVGG